MIHTKVREVPDEATKIWGAKVTRVEVRKPRDVTEAMSRQRKAVERETAQRVGAGGNASGWDQESPDADSEVKK